jgi:PIN domain nuclease of toxin-antitoxin system
VRILLDTHCWLWYLLAPQRLNPAATEVLREQQNEVYFSAASAWEIVVKFGTGKLSLPAPPTEYIPSRLAELNHQSLPILQNHVLRIEQLPPHHRDPFDRVLVAQAQEEELQLMTADRVLRAYEVPIFWAGLDTL